ncbi:MAG: ribosome biogenesis GTP-binding protein YihA/YsxC [Nitrospiria bacterium]
MMIHEAVFVKSCVDPREFPATGWPEIAFAGRSNVGKSSLMNLLLGRKHLVKTSATPGKTQTVNFFAVNRTFYFVDLPGYGYARVPRHIQAGWKSFIESYLAQRPVLQAVVLVLDPRHPPTDLDRQMDEWLRSFSMPVIPVATKADQVPRGERSAAQRRLGLAFGGVAGDHPIFVSAKTGEGKREFWEQLAPVLRSAPSF